MVPHLWNPWPWGRFIGLIVVGAALGIEIQWTLSGAKRPRWLLPGEVDLAQHELPIDVRPDELPGDGSGYLFHNRIADELVKLAQLRGSGALTEEEFVKQKARLLN
jgi:hypothetical protein